MSVAKTANELEKVLDWAKNETDRKDLKLLAEWYEFWFEDNTMPVKMPDGLHVRTLVFLQVEYYKEKGVPNGTLSRLPYSRRSS